MQNTGITGTAIKQLPDDRDGFLQALFAKSVLITGSNSKKATSSPATTAGAEAATFLRHLDPFGRHNLVAIDPEERKPPEGRTFARQDWQAIATWIDERDGRWNLYFSVNEPTHDAPHKKLTKSDIGTIRALCVDADIGDLPAGIDPQVHFSQERTRLRAEIEALENGVCAPSVVLDSGGGYQVFWILKEKLPVDQAKDAEAQGRALAQIVGGDHVQNIDRLMRLPGTMNLPNAKKRAKGQTERRAAIVSTTEVRFSWGALATQFPPVFAGALQDRSPAIAQLMANIDMHAVYAAASFDALPAALRVRFADARRIFPALDALWTSGRPNVDGMDRKDTSRSAARFELAGWLKAGHFVPEEFGALLYVWEHAGKPGDSLADWSDDKLRREIARDWVNSPEKPERLLDDLGDEPPRDDTPPRPARGTWPEPLDLFSNAAPAELGDLPRGALPPMLTRWVRSEARRKGVPEAFAAISAVTAFGAAIGGDVRLQVRQRDDGWTEAANLWSVIVAPPGSAKSPIISAATAALRAVNDRWVDLDTVEHARWAAASKRRGKDAPPPGPEPRIRRTVIDDTTSEKAIRIFRDNRRGILQVPDELAGLLGAFGAYKSGGGSDRPHFLRTFDGGSIISDRVGTGTIIARRALLTVLAGTQPEKLRGLVRDLGTDGLLQRFIVILHDGRERSQSDEEPDREAMTWFNSRIEHLTAAGGAPAEPVRLSPDAGAALSAALDNIKRLKSTPGASDALCGHLEKWGKILPRLALIIHVARAKELATDGDVGATVDFETIDMAVHLARLFIRHAIEFYSTYFDASRAASEAIWIAGFLLTRPELSTVSRRDVYDARTSLRGAENLRALLAAMGELENADWCVAADRDGSGPKTWRINPRVHEQFSARAVREREERSLKRAKIIEAGRARAWVSGSEMSQPAPEIDIFG